MKIIPVILAGGAGTRLWPLSRKSYPKQFTNILSNQSLFQNTAKRCLNMRQLDLAPPIVVTSEDYRFIVRQQLSDIGVEESEIIIEPIGKNTAPAILAASIVAQNVDEDVALLVVPSDHILPDEDYFERAISACLPSLLQQKIVTFGITPNQAETGYGYISVTEIRANQVCEVNGFTEKPDIAGAETMVASGRYLWNSGMFLFRAIDMINAFNTHAPNMFPSVYKAVTNCTSDLGFTRLEVNAWSEVDDISLDYAIMELHDNIVAFAYTEYWSDVGSWVSLAKEMSVDSHNVALSQNALSFSCTNSILRSEDPNLKLVGFGLENIIAIATRDAVLVASKEQNQNIGHMVKTLKKLEMAEAERFPKDYRPWGWFESLAYEEHFQVKRIYVNPSAALSLQSHKYRSEHWVVVKGIAEVTIGDTLSKISEGESVYVPLGEIHRLRNPSSEPLIIIEVQLGSYLGEDDITRYEDHYARN